MANLHHLKEELLNDGRITRDEVNRIRQHVQEDGQLDYDDVQFLVGLLCEAREVCHEFDAFFFPTLKKVLLEDGRIDNSEQYQLLRMLYADGEVRESERTFLRDLYNSSTERTPEFTALCETAFASPASDWDTGGRKTV